ncbi:uncharacterized protein LOC106162557 [Lingula anatina]|uniref:Uncharacterized protein LOC106162557 n=1 Tax=Lingula anatina TaxID=7574 RepID=A0A1S3IAN2_LINAN|nr:uncharacterized protein LOC106162557 [Lingula anatina]|eukprot:XP_013395325.1 uncharacterized protein LOC106162557 [Lingula anatina]
MAVSAIRCSLFLGIVFGAFVTGQIHPDTVTEPTGNQCTLSFTIPEESFGASCDKYDDQIALLSSQLKSATEEYQTQLNLESDKRRDLETLLQTEMSKRQALENKTLILEQRLQQEVLNRLTLENQQLTDSNTVRSELTQLQTQLSNFISSQSKWTLMFKAVKGAGGDLYNLWTSNQVLNEGNALAQSLEPTLLEHYKTSVVNDWAKHNIKYVKLALYQGGIERLTLIFNAVGSDKMNWFAKDRLISSPYVDIYTSSINFFSIRGTPSSVSGQYGRYFYISQSHNGCPKDYGWLAVPNNAFVCAYEKYPAYPVFLYAPGHTAINWAKGKHGEADVLAIFMATE